MAKKHVKKCFVPDCNSNSKDHPTTVFIRLPSGKEIRRKWALAVGRIGKQTVFHESSGVHCCEHHFNLPVDVENWMDVKLHGKKMRLREDALPVRKKPSPKSSRSLLKRPTIQKSNLNHIQEINTQEILISSEDEFEVKKTKHVKHCFVPDCNENSLGNPNKLFLRLPKEAQIQKKFSEVVGEKGMHTVFHENSEVFCCSDHVDLLNPIYLPHIPSTTDNSERQTNQENDESLKIDTESESEEASILRQLLCKQGSSTEFVEVKSEPLHDIQSIQEENSDPVLIKTELVISDYVKLEPETEENVLTEINSECKDEEMQIVEAAKNSAEEIETQYSEEINISENKVEVLRDDVPKHRELRSYLLAKLNKKVGYIEAATSIEAKYLSEDINRSLYQERSSEVLKLLRETQGRSGQRIKNQDILIASSNLDMTKKLVKSFPLRYTGLPPTIFNSFMANVFRDTKLPYSRILLVLLKIRENQSFERLGDDFGISTEKARKRFLQSVPLIANYLKKVPWPQIDGESEIPFHFDNHFENIKLILDCLEIEVEKPKDANAEKLLRHSGKYYYTMKYLISYTRMGLINCVSNGYGGSVSDKYILDNSGYLSRFSFTKKALVLTDRSYPGSGYLFRESNCQLIRLGEEVQRLEWFTCLKKLLEYVENIMKRLREFRLISKHALLSEDLTAILDDVVIIASAIVNTQGSILTSDT